MTDALTQVRTALPRLRGLVLEHGSAAQKKANGNRDYRKFSTIRQEMLATIDEALAAIDAAQGGASAPAVEGVEPVAFIQKEVLEALLRDKSATGTVASGLLKNPFGNPVALYSASAISRLVKERDEAKAMVGLIKEAHGISIEGGNNLREEVARLTALLAEADAVIYNIHVRTVGWRNVLDLADLILPFLNRYQQKREAK
ncbi:MAG: hypothetical protein M9939_00950 [Mesorhizobium sp.]|nr:hypothetical protein [Mesorhizobium sp.]MCO5159676.1 hypothetical protein [Mesorhizobium sp.]